MGRHVRFGGKRRLLCERNRQAFEGIGEEGLGDCATACISLEERCTSATKELGRTLSDKLTSRR